MYSGCIAVSYTHLDVYKRQLFFIFFVTYLLYSYMATFEGREKIDYLLIKKFKPKILSNYQLEIIKKHFL